MVLSDKIFRSVIYDLAVTPEFQNQGIGKELIMRCIEYFPDSEWLVGTIEKTSSYYEKIQLQEAVNRISQCDVRKIIVTTDDILTPAQRMYESVGFKLEKKFEEKNSDDFVCEHIDYVYFL